MYTKDKLKKEENFGKFYIFVRIELPTLKEITLLPGIVIGRLRLQEYYW